MEATRYEQRRLRRMAAHVRGRTVLDVGFAQSPNPFLGGYEVVGLDLEPPAACPPGYAEQIKGDATDLGTALDGRSFDTVLCGELIEHLERPYDFLRDVHESVSPGGRLVLSTPNPVGWPTVLFEWRRSHRRFYTEHHRYYFPPRWVERMLTDTGWRPVAIEGVGLWLPRGPVPRCPAGLSYQVVYAAVRAT